jgi:hypothetical protein
VTDGKDCLAWSAPSRIIRVQRSYSFDELPVMHGYIEYDNRHRSHRGLGRSARRQVLASCPHLDVAAGHVAALAEMLTRRHGHQPSVLLSLPQSAYTQQVIERRLQVHHRTK